MALAHSAAGHLIAGLAPVVPPANPSLSYLPTYPLHTLVCPCSLGPLFHRSSKICGDGVYGVVLDAPPRRGRQPEIVNGAIPLKSHPHDGCFNRQHPQKSSLSR
ncbi:hypothetical protein Y032_0260g511 [Ancylostoma ceylanicum]|uniref:Uncharacterized protein n=1 Tax=Ancylostoma ceylanicum TaxID=53326 RepID=A0A016SB51_9BILA|nr:hypothetical protein Y032_0260g511 [Ancylostoma ceylanicum]